MKPTLALCMIARDEAPVIARALESARALADEILVVDTGSSDATVEIARAHGARVLSHPWQASFADARNVYMREATADWILVLDADEALDAGAAPLIARCMEQPASDGKVCLYWLRELSRLSDAEDGGGRGMEHYIPRLFPRHPKLAYQGAIHEFVAHADGVERLEMRAVPKAVIHHYGYTPSESARKDRNERNLPILEKQVAEHPDDAYAHFNLGSQLNAAGRYAEALAALERSRALAPESRAPFAASRGLIAADCLHRLGRTDEAIYALQQVTHDFPGMADAPFQLGNLLIEKGKPESAEEAYRRAIEVGLYPVPTYFGVTDSGAGTWKPRLQLGMALGRRGRWSEALPPLREARAMAPGLPLAALAYGLAHHHMNLHAEALRIWDEIDLTVPKAAAEPTSPLSDRPLCGSSPFLAARSDARALATPEILCRVAESCVRSGNAARALETAAEAAGRWPESAEARLCEARIRVEAGDGAGALRAYREALAAVPDVAGWLECGEVAAHLGDGAGARAAFEAAARHDPIRPEPLNNLGALAINAGDLLGARRHLGEALRRAPEYDPAAWNMARVYILEGDARRALAFLRQRVGLGKRTVAEILAEWRAVQAGADLGPARHDPVPGLLLACTAAIQSGEGEAAIGWLEALDAAKVAPEAVMPLRVEAEKQRENLGAALGACLRWIETGVNRLAAAQEAGQILMRMGRYEEAARLLDVVLAPAGR